MIIRILDVLTALLVIITLNLVDRNYKFWLIYAFGNFLYIIVVLQKGLYGWAVAGLILFLTGLNNYRKGKKKHDIHRN